MVGFANLCLFYNHETHAGGGKKNKRKTRNIYSAAAADDDDDDDEVKQIGCMHGILFASDVANMPSSCQAGVLPSTCKVVP